MKKVLFTAMFVVGILTACTENKQTNSEKNMQKLELTQE